MRRQKSKLNSEEFPRKLPTEVISELNPKEYFLKNLLEGMMEEALYRERVHHVQIHKTERNLL